MEGTLRYIKRWMFISFISLITGAGIGNTITFTLFNTFISVFQQNLSESQLDTLYSSYTQFKLWGMIFFALFNWVVFSCFDLLLENIAQRRQLSKLKQIEECEPHSNLS